MKPFRTIEEILPLPEQHPIAIWLSAGAIEHHVGLAFLDEQNRAKRLHLAWHHKLCCDELESDEGTVGTSSGMDDVSAQIFCAILRHIPQFAPRIAYGTDWIGARGSFDSNGLYTPPTNSLGLTCASFVSEVFAGAGHQVVDEESWPVGTPENLEWKARIVELLRQHLPKNSQSQQHINHIEQFDAVARLKPAEIAGAVADDAQNWPLEHSIALGLAQRVIADFANIGN